MGGVAPALATVVSGLYSCVGQSEKSHCFSRYVEEVRHQDRPSQGDAELVLLQRRIGVTLGIGGL